MSPALRILLINQYAGSPRDGMEYRPHALAREWQAAGHEALIVAGSPRTCARAILCSVAV